VFTGECEVGHKRGWGGERGAEGGVGVCGRGGGGGCQGGPRGSKQNTGERAGEGGLCCVVDKTCGSRGGHRSGTGASRVGRTSGVRKRKRNVR